LDYIRANLFDPAALRLLPPDVQGPDNDLADLLDHYVRRAVNDPTVAAYVFGQRFGPEPTTPDKVFGFLPGWPLGRERAATVCHPGSGRVTASFAAVARHYGAGVRICPSRRGGCSPACPGWPSTGTAQSSCSTGLLKSWFGSSPTEVGT
jgi:hypothetical protein